jgi:hypothetical protein
LKEISEKFALVRFAQGVGHMGLLWSYIRPYFFAAALFSAPFLVIYYFRFQSDIPELELKYGYVKGNYKDAIQIITSCSQWMVTISISLFAGGGFLFIKSYKEHPLICKIAMVGALCSGILSIYYAIIISQVSAIFLSKEILLIDYVNAILRQQAISILFSAAFTTILIIGAKEK